MNVSSKNKELNKYWRVITPKQHKAFTQLIKTFNEAENAVDKNELQEAQAEYIIAKTSLTLYWDYLMPEQQDALVKFIIAFYPKNFNEKDELKKLNDDYSAPVKLFKQLNEDQEKSLIVFFDAAGIDPENGINITEYNKEIDEAMARIDAGEFYTHEQVVEMSKQWLSGK